MHAALKSAVPALCLAALSSGATVRNKNGDTIRTRASRCPRILFSSASM